LFFQVLNWARPRRDCASARAIAACPAERVVFKHPASAFKRTRVFVDSGF
jgi:hypothetical protein